MIFLEKVFIVKPKPVINNRGGFNPFEKYARQIGSFPQISGWKFQKYLSCHHLDTSDPSKYEKILASAKWCFFQIFGPTPQPWINSSTPQPGTWMFGQSPRMEMMKPPCARGPGKPGPIHQLSNRKYIYKCFVFQPATLVYWNVFLEFPQCCSVGTFFWLFKIMARSKLSQAKTQVHPCFFHSNQLNSSQVIQLFHSNQLDCFIQLFHPSNCLNSSKGPGDKANKTSLSFTCHLSALSSKVTWWVGQLDGTCLSSSTLWCFSKKSEC